MNAPTKILVGTVVASLTALGIGFVASQVDSPGAIEAHTTSVDVEPMPPMFSVVKPSPTAAMDT